VLRTRKDRFTALNLTCTPSRWAPAFPAVTAVLLPVKHLVPAGQCWRCRQFTCAAGVAPASAGRCVHHCLLCICMLPDVAFSSPMLAIARVPQAGYAILLPVCLQQHLNVLLTALLPRPRMTRERCAVSSRDMDQAARWPHDPASRPADNKSADMASAQLRMRHQQLAPQPDRRDSVLPIATRVHRCCAHLRQLSSSA